MTYDDYCKIPEDGNRYEVIEGLLYMSPAPALKHQRIIRRLSVRLIAQVEEANTGEVLFAPCDVVLSDHDIVQPDILFVRHERSSILTEKNVQGAPDLIIEVLSEGCRRRDEVVKRTLYERHGVPEYWIVDPELETVKVYRLRDGAYGKPLLLSRDDGDVLESPMVAGFQCNLSVIFGE